MFREVAHFVRHAPATLALKRRVSQEELYETVMARADEAGMAAERAALVSDLGGKVLEIGAGTGAMFSYYARDVELAALEPEARFAELARPKADAARCNVALVIGSALEIPFAAATFDAVVSALVLCSVADPARVLAEITRVARPGAAIRLIEHVKSPDAVAGALMTMCDPIWVALNGQGCHMNRDTEATLVRAGFVIDAVHPFQIFSAGLPAFPMRRIEARIAAR